MTPPISPPNQTKLRPETLQQQIERKLYELMKICKQDVDKLSKPTDRNLELLQDTILDIPLEPLPVKEPFSCPPILKNKLVLEPIPILHRYKTRSVTKNQSHPLPRVSIPLPRVQNVRCESPPRVLKTFELNANNTVSYVSPC